MGEYLEKLNAARANAQFSNKKAMKDLGNPQARVMNNRWTKQPILGYAGEETAAVNNELLMNGIVYCHSGKDGPIGFF